MTKNSTNRRIRPLTAIIAVVLVASLAIWPESEATLKDAAIEHTLRQRIADYKQEFIATAEQDPKQKKTTFEYPLLPFKVEVTPERHRRMAYRLLEQTGSIVPGLWGITKDDPRVAAQRLMGRTILRVEIEENKSPVVMRTSMVAWDAYQYNLLVSNGEGKFNWRTDHIEAPKRWSVLPPLLAVAIAFVFHRVLLALFLAVAAGALLSSGFTGAPLTFVEYIWATVSNTGNLLVILFTSVLLGMVNLLNRSGGNHGLLQAIRRWATSSRSTQGTAVTMGTAIFFDDYANSMLVGTSMRRLSDWMRISREKLAYIVDSTSAPVAGIALVSTWVGYEVGLFNEIAGEVGLGTNGYGIFLLALVFRFYCIFTLIFMITNVWSRREFGPMRTAELRTRETGNSLADDARPLTVDDATVSEPPDGAPKRWFNAVIPVAVVLISIIVGVIWLGHPAAADISVWRPGFWRQVFVAASDAIDGLGMFYVMAGAALAGSIVAMVLPMAQGILNLDQAATAWARGIWRAWVALLILIGAWSIKEVCTDLNTSLYLIDIFKPHLSPLYAPILTFGLAGAIAFMTGTSWGTMAILIPTMVPLTYELGMAASLDPETIRIITLLSCAAVLDGAIFGDHCSPISDTTLLSSIATGCDHIHHVRTQAPYAITTMIVAATAGYLLTPHQPWVAINYLIGVGLIVAVLYLLGRRVPSYQPES